MTEHRLLHALDLAILRDWQGAKAALESLDDPRAARLFSLVSELDDYDARRRKGDAHLRHEIGNALSIVRASLEGIIDNVVPATPERLKGMSEALVAASVLLDDLRKEPEPERAATVHAERVDLGELVSSQTAMVVDLAASKALSIVNACAGSFAGDIERSERRLRNVLIGSIRFAPPYGSVRIESDAENGELAFTISGLDDGAGIPRTLLRGEGIGAVSVDRGTLHFRLRLAREPFPA
jgi:two-component system sensor histidine kinase BaeS